MDKKFWLGLVAYVVPSFPMAFAWHLTIFAENYAALDLLRADPILPMGFATMLMQGALFSWMYPRLFSTERANWQVSAMKAFAVFGLTATSYAGDCSKLGDQRAVSSTLFVANSAYLPLKLELRTEPGALTTTFGTVPGGP